MVAMSLLRFAILHTDAQRSTYCNAGGIPPRCNLGSKLGLANDLNGLSIVHFRKESSQQAHPLPGRQQDFHWEKQKTRNFCWHLVNSCRSYMTERYKNCNLHFHSLAQAFRESDLRFGRKYSFRVHVVHFSAHVEKRGTIVVFEKVEAVCKSTFKIFKA